MADNDSSGLRQAAAAAPFVAGLGIGLRNIINEGNINISPATSPTLETMRAVYSADTIKSQAQQIAFKASHVQEFFRTYLNKGGSTELAQTAWIQAMRSIDPLTQRNLARYVQNIDTMAPNEAFASIRNVFLSNQSGIVQNQLFDRFSRNLSALGDQWLNAAVWGDRSKYAAVTHKFAPGIRLDEPTGLKPSLRRIKDVLGDYSSRFFAGEGGYGVYRFDFASKFGNVQMTVPLTNQGILVEGTTQTTRRIAPDVLLFDPEANRVTERLSREQYLLRQVEESILPDIKSGRLSSHRDIQRAMKELYTESIQSLESVPNTPGEVMSKAQQRLQSIKGQQVDIRVAQQRVINEHSGHFISGFRRPSSSEFAAAIQAENLFGSTGPGALAQGRASYIDLTEQSLTPNLVDTSRRPDQAVREYQLTRSSIEQLRDVKNKRYLRYRTYQSSANRMHQSGIVNPNLKIMYVNPEDPRFKSRFVMGEGEAVGRSGLRSLLEFEAPKSTHLTHLKEGITERIAAGEKIVPSEVLGFTESGAPFQATKDMEILATTAHKNKGRGDYTTVHYRQKAGFTHADKIFGDVKALVLMRENNELRQFARSVNAAKHMQEVDLLVDIGTLKKDPAKHAKQILTGMAETLHSRPIPFATPQIKDFIENVEKYGGQWSQGGHQSFVEKAMQFAVKEGDFTAKEFGTVFGAAPVALGEEGATTALSRAGIGMSEYAQYRGAMFGGIAGGVGEVVYDSPAALKGVGSMGSIEPRANEILRRGPLGQLGVELSDELNQRLALTNPEKMQVHKELGKTISSITGELKPGSSNVFNIGEDFNRQRFQSFLEQGGGYLDPGKGMNKIYVPGANIVDKMRPFETAAGEKVIGNLSDIYHDMAKSAAKMYDVVDPISPGQYEKELQGHMQNVFKHYAPAAKGMGSIQRGKILGTRFLRGVSEAGGQTITQANVAGISDEMFAEMMDEMESSRLYSRDKLNAMRESFRRGNTVGGLISRHPFIGEYSMQAINFKRVAGAGKNIVIPELTTQVTAAVDGEYKTKTLRLGPLVGMAGDKDADMFSAMLVSPDKEKEIRQLTQQADNAFTQRYTQHQVRMQLFEAGKPADEGLSIRQKMLADIQKTAAPKLHVAPLSVQMSEAKRALGAFGKGQAAGDAAFMLEWLEQTPISAKHMSARQVAGGGLEAMMTDISDAMRTRDAARLESVIQNIVKDDAVAQNMLTGSVRISKRNAEDISRLAQSQISRNLSGVNVQAGLQEMMRSLGEYEVSGMGRMDQIASARGPRVKMAEAADFLTTMGGAMGAEKTGLMASVSRAAQSAQNILGAMGRGIVKHHKPIGLGFAGSLALAGVLSNPKDTIGPHPPGPDPRGIMNKSKASSNMNAQNLHPAGATIGNPTAPAVPWPQRAMLNFGPSQQVHVKARTQHFINTPAMAASLSEAHRGPLSVDLHDHRQTLNENLIANKMMQ